MNRVVRILNSVDQYYKTKEFFETEQFFAGEAFYQLRDINRIMKNKMKLSPTGQVQVFLFGAGSGASSLQQSEILDGIIDGVVDNDEKKWRTYLGPYLIQSPDALLPNTTTTLITSHWHNEIRQQLIEMGKKDGVDFINLMPLIRFIKKGLKQQPLRYSANL